MTPARQGGLVVPYPTDMRGQEMYRAIQERFDEPREIHPFLTFAANDATPSVRGGRNFRTANTAPTTITALDSGVDGQVVMVKIGDANTTIDFTGTTLQGNAGANWSPASGDFMVCTFDGTNWLCAITEA